MRTNEVNACSFDQWYKLFSNPRRTLKSKIIPLTEDFIQYLQEDGVILPQSITTTSKRNNEEFSDSSSDWSDEEEENVKIEQQKEFPKIQQAIQEALDEYEYVFPKLNWSAPKDATWILSENRIKCVTVEDVFLCLKSSQFIIHDLLRAYDGIEGHDKTKEVQRVLVLRKWYNIKPSMEFRCFIKNKEMVGICQRDCTNYYPFLKNKKEEYKNKLFTFWKDEILPKFPLDNYVVDLYISTKNVWIIDFNVFGEPTESLLFKWDEEFKKDDIEFRIIESEQGIQPSLSMYSRLPHDLIDVSNASKIEEFIEKYKQ